MTLKLKSPVKLFLSILVTQLAGFIGSIFTFSAIPTWYAQLNKPSFSPPNWIFGPVWTILYVMMGISFYLIWTRNKGNKYSNNKFFLFHLFLNSLWSILFFGLKNPGVAFFEIIILWLSIIYMIIKFNKVSKLASYLLVPYLCWVSFASFLNFSIWRLNPTENSNIFAQGLSYETAKSDYIYVQDKYRQSLISLNFKKDSYQKNKTLSLKEEARVVLIDFLVNRSNYIKSYLTLVRTKVLYMNGLTSDEKQAIYSKIDPEVVWYENRIKDFQKNDSLEMLLQKSNEDDSRYDSVTKPIIYFSLINIDFGEIYDLKDQNKSIYESLKKEADDLVKLKRADSNLFERWFKDIDLELNKISEILNSSKSSADKMFSTESYSAEKSYEDALEKLLPSKDELLQLNKFVGELEIAISQKR